MTRTVAAPVLGFPAGFSVASFFATFTGICSKCVDLRGGTLFGVMPEQ
jgi:hypothetical protein